MSQGHEAVERLREDASNARKARLVVVLILAGLTSFGLAGAVGWSLGGLRGSEGEPIAGTPPSHTSADVATRVHSQGELLFQVHCARCHGTSGHGDGPYARLAQVAAARLFASGQGSGSRSQRRSQGHCRRSADARR